MNTQYPPTFHEQIETLTTQRDELLTALKRLEREGDSNEAWAQAQDAIAKAEGRAQ